MIMNIKRILNLTGNAEGLNEGLHQPIYELTAAPSQEDGLVRKMNEQ